VIYRVSLISSARIDATTTEMKALKGDFATAAGNELVDQVAAMAAGQQMLVRKKVDRVGDLRLQVEGKDLGDIDVLAADPARSRIWAIECKNLGMARTPWELWSEIRKFDDPDGGILAKHGRRIAWLADHQEAVVEWLGLEKGRWAIVPLIVVSEDLMSRHMRQMSIPTVPLSALERRLMSTEGLGRGSTGTIKNRTRRPKSHRRRSAARRGKP
jgi:hypothetical protein